MLKGMLVPSAVDGSEPMVDCGRRDDRRWGEPPASARQVTVRKDEQQQRDRRDQPDRALGKQRDEPSERSRCPWVPAEHLPEPLTGCGVAECQTDEGE